MTKENYIIDLKKKYSANELLEYFNNNKPKYNLTIRITRNKFDKPNTTYYFKTNGEKWKDHRILDNSIVFKELEDNKYEYR